MAADKIIRLWFVLMAIGGLAFGLIGDRRPFGAGTLGHPVVVYFIVVAAVLLVARFALARPIPEIIPDRMLMLGCGIGLVAFLIANWLSVRFVV